MKKLIKIAVIIVAVLVVLGIAAVTVGIIFIDKIVKTGIVTVAPGITQTPVTLEAVHISLMNGEGTLKGFVIGNPEGFKTPYAVSVGKATLSVVPSSIMADKIVIHTIDVQSPEVAFEGNPFGDNNLKKIMSNVDSGAAATDKSAAKTPAQPAQSQGAAKKLQLDNFSMTGIKIHATLSGVSSFPGMEGKELTLPIPDIKFTQLGTGPDGITAADLTQKILQQISTETIEAVADNVKSLASGAAANVLKGGAPATESIKKGLGGMLGK
jgi:hypothetical protein